MTTANFLLPGPNALPGQVLSLPFYRPSDFPPGSCVLCRNNAPLVSHAYGLLSRDVPCRILGRDIGAALISIVKKMYTDDIETFLERLRAWHQREVQRAMQEDRSPDTVDDQYTCLTFFVRALDETARTVPDLIAKIDLLFTDDGPSPSRVTLASIHKAKGLEFPIVFILDRGLLPSKYAKQKWQQVQERNLLYVAVTRSSDKLFYIQSGMWKDETSAETSLV